MKKLVSTLSCVALFASSSLFGQVTTDPVGYVTIDVPAGTSLISLPLQKSKVFEGAVTGVTTFTDPEDGVDGTTISANFSDLGSAFSYVQVVESTGALGAIASITSTGSGTIDVKPTIPNLEEGDRIAVRPHMTLADIKGNPEFTDGTSLVVFTSNGTRESFTYFSAESLSLPEGLWADDDFEDASNVAVLPSEGFVMDSGSASAIIISGAVSTDPLKYPFGGTFSLTGTLSPSDSVTLKEAFGDLPIGSTISLRSSDGTLSTLATYDIFDSSDLGLGEGKTFVRDAEFLGDDDLIESGVAVVIAPPQSTDGVVLPAAYTSN
ncbi:MAG: hypothetical protein GVY36_10915 [Verrucomicrobia bacterium]|nr:hypothetical protein [Verrucomicrobiota bacterium]